jgi:hypothetical protein
MNLIKDRGINEIMLFNLLAELGYASIKDYQQDNGLVADGIFGINSYTALYKKLLKVENVNFEGYYFKQAYPKNQIIWHHSAGWDNARGMFDWWKNDGVTHVATSCGITDDGTLWKGFDEQYWAASIGSKHPNNRQLDKEAVAIEVCNWGCLTESNGKYLTWANVELDKDSVIELDYKGFKYYEKYTDEEIKTLKYWTLLNAIRFNIPVNYRESDMWELSNDALMKVPGIYTHNSYRTDKTDVSPQPKLISMAKSLELYMK